MGLKQQAVEMTISKSGKAIMFYDKDTRRRFTAPITQVTKFLGDDAVEHVDFALLVNDKEG